MKRSLYLFLISMLVFSACKKEKFIYESEWLTPLFNTSLGIEDVIVDSSLVKNADNSFDLVLKHEEKIDSLLDILEVPDSVDEVSVSLTQLILDDRTYTDTLTLVEMYPPAILLNGQTTTLDPQDITSDKGTTIDVSEQFFQTATFNEGYLDITIYNDLPVDIETIEYELVNFDDRGVIISDAFSDLEAFTSVSETYDLAGKTVDGKMDALLKRIKTKASNGDVLIEANKGIRVELKVRDLKPQSATAIFPAQNLIEREDETTYNFGGPMITTMFLLEGEVEMKVFSTINEAIILEYEVPQSKHKVTGESIKKTFVIPPAKNGVPSEVDQSFPIKDFEITYKGKDKSVPPFYNTFYSTLTARIEYTGEVRTLSLEDSVYIRFGLVNVKPDLAIGDFGKKTYTFSDPLDVPLFKDMDGAISLDDASLILGFENTFGIEASIDIDGVEGINSRNGKSVAIASTNLNDEIFIPRAVNILTGVRPASKTVEFNKSNSNLKLFLENTPDRVKPKFTVTTRPYGSNNLTDFAFYHSYMKTSVNLQVPLNVGMQDLTLVRKQAFDWKDEDLNELKSGKFRLKVGNSFPWSASMKIEFMNDAGEVLKTYLGTADDLVKAGNIDQQTAKVISESESELEFDLAQEDILKLKEATQIRITAVFNTLNGNRYKIYDDYSMDLKLIGDFIYEN